MSKIEASEKIDFVLTWVDGNDPKWLEEKEKYDTDQHDNSATANRFRDMGLLKYWFRGVEEFAPWVNHIFLVTCGQCPDWIDLSNPRLSLVTHDEYIPKDILPTFNSNVIEMHLHNIKELSEHFVLFNDDIFIIKPTHPKDFFVDGLPCESALLGVISSQNINDVFPHILINNNAIINKHFSKKEVLLKNKNKFFSIRYGKDIIRNIALLPFVYFSDFRDMHLPASHLKSIFEEVWEAEPEEMRKRSSNRFRSINDINHWLIKDWYICKGQFFPRSPKWGKKFELGIEDGAGEYIRNQTGKTVCLNDSIDTLDFRMIQSKLIDAFECILPDKSSFEK
ncbi:stealth family protein [Oribacterium sp. P6A1]|uniref:stealth family protein n=1 Tax=Oribacterium sp. P6A1 TaxID=1410612 RepID=UPI000B09AB44|nr:Stealth CR1 domain-containing protein [Oribacterium sp. P6A1]